MKLSDFDYVLPPELIAQYPAEPRDCSRLMVVHPDTGRIDHRVFQDLPEFIHPGDTLVFNDSRVIPARLKGAINATQKQAEILLLKRLSGDTWEALVKPGRKLMPGSCITFSPGCETGIQPATATIIDRKENGTRIIQFSHPNLIDEFGEMPLPPYIKSRLADRERYQTVYSDEKGSAAAPTAGLHFTRSLLSRLKERGINLAFVTLHIGLDTFQPVRVEDPQLHRIHTEFGQVDKATADLLNRTKESGRNVIAVGTTSVRVIEAATSGGKVHPMADDIKLFILPGYKFKAVDGIITNFHLPRSTLIMMISAFAGRELILNCYEQAKRSGYRFYSFGDAMFIM